MGPSKSLQRFVATIAEGQTKPMTGFVRDMLYGIIASGSTLLTETVRVLGEDIKSLSTEIRLSRNLANPKLRDDELRSRYLKIVEPFLQDAVVAVDLSDIAKPHSRKQEYLCRVMDESAKWAGNEPRLVNGYQLLCVEAMDQGCCHFPLWLELFSTKMPGHTSQTNVVLAGVAKVAPHVGKRCTWVFDRGFDADSYFQGFEAMGITYCIRIKAKGKNNRIVSGPDGQWRPIGVIAASVQLQHSGQSPQSGKHPGQPFQFGSCLVTFRAQTEQYRSRKRLLGQTRRLIVAQMPNRPDRLVLITNRTDQSVSEDRRAVVAYSRRWGIEEGTRFMKQVFDLENVRPIRFAAIQRLVLLASLAYGYVCLFARKAGKRLLEQVLDLYKSFGDTPNFIYYRLVEAMRIILIRAGP